MRVELTDCQNNIVNVLKYLQEDDQEEDNGIMTTYFEMLMYSVPALDYFHN